MATILCNEAIHKNNELAWQTPKRSHCQVSMCGCTPSKTKSTKLVRSILEAKLSCACKCTRFCVEWQDSSIVKETCLRLSRKRAGKSSKAHVWKRKAKLQPSCLNHCSTTSTSAAIQLALLNVSCKSEACTLKRDWLPVGSGGTGGSGARIGNGTPVASS